MPINIIASLNITIANWHSYTSPIVAYFAYQHYYCNQKKRP